MKILYLLLTLLNFNIILSNDLKIAVFCSADDKVNKKFKSIAYSLGKELGLNNLGLVTGGSRTGLMKEVIDGYISTSQNRKNLYGILPKVLKDYNVHHSGIPNENLKWVDTIHIRLSHFHDLTNAIIVLPGGFGTLHELMDFLVHNQFGINKNKIILMNCDNFWGHLLAQFKVMVQNNILLMKHLNNLIVADNEYDCLEIIKNNHLSENNSLESRYWES